MDDAVSKLIEGRELQVQEMLANLLRAEIGEDAQQLLVTCGDDGEHAVLCPSADRLKFYFLDPLPPESPSFQPVAKTFVRTVEIARRQIHESPSDDS